MEFGLLSWVKEGSRGNQESTKGNQSNKQQTVQQNTDDATKEKGIDVLRLQPFVFGCGWHVLA